MTGMYLYRSHNDRIVAVTDEAHAGLDPSQFKAAIVGGRPMPHTAAMSLLNRFGGILISEQGRQRIRARRQ